MGAADLRHQWNRRLGMFASGVFSFGLSMAAIVVGSAFYVSSDLRRPLWLVGAFLAALWLVLQGGPLLIRLAEKAGLFGKVRIEGGRLFLNSGLSVDLEKPMAVEARHQHSTIHRSYDLRGFFGSWSTSRRDIKYQLGVTVFTLFIEQDGRCYVLAADETSRRPGRKYILDGLNVRKVGIGFPKGRPIVRLWPADLAEILGVLQHAKGYSTALSPVPDKAPEDPRKIICPIWKTALGAAITVMISVAALAWIYWYSQQDV